MVSGPSLTLGAVAAAAAAAACAQSVYRMVLRFMFLRGTHALHGEQRILRTAVAFFANAALLAPQVAVDGVALRHFVVAEALLEAHPPAVAELAQQAQHLPLDIRGRLLGRIAEINFVLDLEPAQLRFKKSQFFVESHREFSNSQSRAYATGGRGTRWSREGWNESTRGSFWLLAFGCSLRSSGLEKVEF